MDITDQNGNNPTEVFVGTAWQVALVQSLLENAEVKAYIYYGGHGTTASRDSRSCFPLNRVMYQARTMSGRKRWFASFMNQ